MIGLVDCNNFYVSCERLFDRKLVGKRVAVLSNNDGCCVAMSPEFKQLGIPRGTPYFKLKAREKIDELHFRSSNYELYGDISRRVILVLKSEAVEVEQYSIDEAFVIPPSMHPDNLQSYGELLREKILRWVGIPCGVGFASTRTLAKIANHLGKKRPSGVCVLKGDVSSVLEETPAVDVWGVGRRLSVKLRAERIFNARQLRDASADVLRSIGGVNLMRTAIELRGENAVVEKEYDHDPDSVSCSRSFGEPVTTRQAMGESLATFAAQAAVKLRSRGMLASGCNVYVQPANFESEFICKTVIFPNPTDATNEIIAAISPLIDKLYSSTERYRKSGIVFFGLEKAGALRQLDLFSSVKTRDASPLYATIDSLNKALGNRFVRVASEGLETRESVWTMKRKFLSARATTNWDEIPTAY